MVVIKTQQTEDRRHSVTDPPGTDAKSLHQLQFYITGLLGVTELDHYHQPRTVLSDYTHLVPIPPD